MLSHVTSSLSITGALQLEVHQHAVAYLLQSTVLREVWRAIYARAQTAHAQTPHQGGALDLKSAELIQRVLSSLDPNCMMVFVMNLLEPGMPPLLHCHVAKVYNLIRSDLRNLI